MRIHHLIFGLLFSIALFAMPNAKGQQTSEEQGERLVLEEVIVTATKREASLSEIPLAVTAISGKSLEEKAAFGFADYLKEVPGVQYNPSGNIFGQQISIRGVTDAAGGVLSQTPVAIYLDESPITVSQGSLNIDYSVYDLEQVVIIKGPHSTLYGAGSLGGTIKYETSKPDLQESHGRVLASLESTHKGDLSYAAKASWSGPLSEIFALGVTAYHSDQGGFIDDPSRDKNNINSAEKNGGRIIGLLQPSDDLSIVGTFYYQKTDYDGQDLYSPELGDLISRPLVIDQPQSDELKMGSLVIRYAFSSTELVSATSYFDRTAYILADFSNSFLNLGIPGAIVPSEVSGPSQFFSQEVRLASTGDQNFQWSIGGFYSNEDYGEQYSIPHSVVGELFGGDAEYNWETLAFFGEVGYLFDNGFELTGGARWTDYKFDTLQYLSGLFVAPGTEFLDTGFSETDVSPRAALAYHTDWGTTYIQAAKGFRLGQANVPIVSLPGEVIPDVFNSDSLWNYEIGAKTEWFNRRMTLNVAAYYIDWSDIQQTLTSGTGFSYIANTGNADIYGAEVELDALLTDSLRLTAAMALNHGELADDVPGVAPKGTTLPDVPGFTFNSMLDYRFQMFEGESYAQLNYLYYGAYDDVFSIPGNPSPENGGYSKFDFRLGWTRSNFDLTFFVANITDERPVLVRSYSNGLEVTTLRPRTFGMSLGYRF